MAKLELDMKGSYQLTNEEIDERVSKKSPGNYALGYRDEEDKKFVVRYVGRSDDDLKQRLKKQVEEYKRFKFSYATSSKEAFKKECKNYHDSGESENLDNTNHPDRPDDSDWECPFCDNFD